MTDPQPPSGLWRGAFQVVLAYAIFASLWILLSDRAMSLMFTDHDLLVQAGMVKGWLFVAVTSLLLYVLVRRFVGQLQTAHRHELEALLRQQHSLQLLDTLVESSDDAIFAKDAEGRYLLFNQAAADIVGKPVEAVLGHDDRALFPADQAEMLMQIGRRVMTTGQIETNEEVIDTPSGRRTFLATKGPLHDADGGIFGIFGISRDITGRKQAEEKLRDSNASLQKVIDNPVVGVMFWDTVNGLLMDANATFLNFVGYDRHALEAGELTWQRLTPPEYIVLSQAEMVKLHTTGRIGPYQKEYLCKDGRRLWLLFAGSALGGDSAIEFCIDISALKEAETELQHRNEELERFNQAAIERELRMIALKQEVNALAHELGRSPPYALKFLKGDTLP